MKINTHAASIALILGLAAPLTTVADDTPSKNYGSNFVGKQLVLNAKGISSSYTCYTPETNTMDSTQAICFDVPLFNMKTGAYVGTLTDRLTELDVNPDTLEITAIATSTFHFTEWKKQPSFTTRVLGNVLPVIEGSEPMTHVTGFMPAPGENNIIKGSGHFQYATGSARESGLAELTPFLLGETNEVNVDYIWVINLD